MNVIFHMIHEWYEYLAMWWMMDIVLCYLCIPVLLGGIYRDWRLTTNFELWVEIFCVPTCFHMRIPKPCLSDSQSVFVYPEKRNHPGFVNISPTLVIDTSKGRSSWVLQHGKLETQEVDFFFQKVRNWQNWILSVPLEKKSPWLRRYQSYINN